MLCINSIAGIAVSARPNNNDGYFIKGLVIDASGEKKEGWNAAWQGKNYSGHTG
jgi:hypothetical protein